MENEIIIDFDRLNEKPIKKLIDKLDLEGLKDSVIKPSVVSFIKIDIFEK